MAATPAGVAAHPLRRLSRLLPLGRLGAFAAGAALVALLARLFYAPYQAVYGGTGADYVAFATGSRMVAAGDRCLYCLPHQADAQAALLGYRPPGPGFPAAFFNAPLAAWVLQPVATLSLADGLRLFVAGLVVATAVSTALARRRLTGLGRRTSLVVSLACIATLPGAMGLVLAQWTPLLLACALAALFALRGSRPLLAGLLLSVLFIKPQVCLLLLPALLVARRWRLALGVTIGAAAWWGTGFALAGPSFPRDYAALGTRLAREGVTTAGLPSLAGFTPWGTAGVMPLAVVTGAACLTVLITVRRRLQGDPEMAVVLGIAMSLLAAPHVFGDDLLLLVPALLVLAQRRSAAHTLLVVALLDIGYLVDEHLLHTGPRALEALCTLLTVVLLVVPAIRSERPWRGPRPSRLAAALAGAQRFLARLDAPAPRPTA